MVITIDGLSATGKSTVAKKLANTLHYTYFNTGLVYRMITYVILEYHLENIEDILSFLESISLEILGDTIILNNKDITGFLYTVEISLLTSKYSVFPEIKEWVRALQKNYVDRENLVIEGRDIGTAVASSADIKFYLYASLEERAKRLMKRDHKLTFMEAKKELEVIDLKNKASKDFIEPKDAIQIDTTCLSLEEVYEKMISFIPDQV